MESDRRLLKIAGILYGILGVFLLWIPVYGAFLIISGIYFYLQSREEEEEIYKRRVFNYIIAFFGFINILSTVFVLTAQDNIKKRIRLSNGINAPPKVIRKLSKESRKIDIMIKLGVGMIFISGLLFATTSWTFINDYIKALALILFGVFFLGLSLYSEQKLKLYRSSYMYWLLSVSLFLLTIVGILYFGIFGEYLTYMGNGKELAYAITFLTGAGFALTSFYKYPKKYLLYTCYALIVLAISRIFAYVNLSEMMSVSLITIFVMIMNIADKKKGTIHLFSNILSYLLFGFIMVASSTNEYEILFACAINILNLNYLTLIGRQEDESILNIILSYILILFGFGKCTPLGNFTYMMQAISITIYTLLINGNVLSTKRYVQRINYLAYSIIMAILVLLAIEKSDFILPLTYILIVVLHLGVNTLIKHGLCRIEPWKFTNYIQPLLMFILVDSVVAVFHIPITMAYEMAIAAILYCIMNFIYKNELDKNITFGYLIGIIAISLLNPVDYSEVYSSLLFMVTSLYAFTTSYLEETERNKTKIILSYLMLLSSLYAPFVLHNVLGINIIYPGLVFIVLVFIIAPLLKNEWIQKISYLYIILPLYTMIQSAGLNSEVQKILESISGMYLIFLINKFFIKNSIAKNIISIIGIVLFCTEALFTEGLFIGIYIGILGLIIIMIGYKNDELFPIFVTGIIMTILNIIYRLREVWKLVPFWLYLLVGGLSIIGFVTYKELKKQNEKDEKN